MQIEQSFMISVVNYRLNMARNVVAEKNRLVELFSVDMKLRNGEMNIHIRTM